MSSHIIDRTSPKGKGMPFFGTCRLCGQEGLTPADVDKPCSGNTMSADETVLQALEPVDGAADDGPIEFVDRYSALGMPRPEPGTVCEGDCEGTGYVPISADEPDPVYRKLWQEAEDKESADDGWHFVRCPTCGGTGKRPTVGAQ